MYFIYSKHHRNIRHWHHCYEHPDNRLPTPDDDSLKALNEGDPLKIHKVA